ncbi:MAG: ROK family protein, partial [Acidimicrobiales bacterium]
MSDEAHDEPSLCLAVDVGGTKLAVGLVEEEGGLVWQDRVRTPQASDPEALFRIVADLVEIAVAAAAGRGALVACGIGCGGPMSNGLVSPINIPAWRGFPLAARVGGLCELRDAGIPVGIDNDAKALALAEGWCGAAIGRRNFLAMVVSTGVGGGIVLDGRLLEGAAGNAGHIGHVIVEPDGQQCGCGARGCLEAEVSGTAIQAITGGAPEDASPEVQERCGRLVGRAVASVANLLDLPLALVGGSVALGYGLRF